MLVLVLVLVLVVFGCGGCMGALNFELPDKNQNATTVPSMPMIVAVSTTLRMSSAVDMPSTANVTIKWPQPLLYVVNFPRSISLFV